MVLGSLGVAGDTDARARLVEDLDDLVVEVVDDLYLRAFAWADGDPGVHATPRRGRSPARAVGDPQAHLEPAGQDPRHPAGRRVAFARAVREEIEPRKRRLGILSYDDLLSQLADALEPRTTRPARARMRQRWRIVLVDEFQDTDPVQWQVLDRAFSGHATHGADRRPQAGHLRLPRRRRHDVPRGGRDRHHAARRSAVNWRSDAALLDVAADVLAGAELGDQRIVVHDVSAHHQELAAGRGAVRRRRSGCGCVRRDQLGKPRRRSRLLVGARRGPTSPATSPSTSARCSPPARTFEGEPLEPRDVAVIATATSTSPPPASRAPRGGRARPSSPAAAASSQPRPRSSGSSCSRRSSSRTAAPGSGPAALTCFFGHTARELDERGRRAHRRGRPTGCAPGPRCSRLRGVAAVLEAATRGRAPGPRAAPRSAASAAHRPAPHRRGAARGRAHRAARRWSRCWPGCATRSPRRATAAAPSAPAASTPTPPPSSWSPSTPARACEYPVVYLPGARRPQRARSRRCRSSTTPRAGAASTSAGRAAPAGASTSSAGAAEEAGEWLRLLYVAITRAQSQVVALVGAHPQHPGLAAAADARGPPARAGAGAGRVRHPHRRRGGRQFLERWHGRRRTDARAGGPRRRRRRAAPAGRCRRSTCAPSPAPSTSAGGARPTPRSPPSRPAHARWPAASPASRRWSPRTTRRLDARRAVEPPRRSRRRSSATVPSPMADLPGGRDVRLARPRRARARRPRRRRPARRAARPHRRAAGPVAGRRSTAGELRRRAGRGLRLARSAASPPPPCAGCRCATGCASWSSSCRSPAAT